MSARTPQQIRTELLKSALESISIPPSVYQKAMERYRTLTEFLDDPRTQVGLWKPAMYVQGSAALGLTTKPPGRQDFDFDVTLELASLPSIPAGVARNAVEKRLREDANYARMLNTEKNRCLRLDYAKDERFHIDVVVGRSASWVNATGTGIQVTDRKLADWVWSDPLGFIAWFEERKKQVPTMRYLRDGRGTMIKASADPAPEQPQPEEKLPLQWVIQIMKRHRDLMFLSDPTEAPISIILTTLAAKAYQGEGTIEAALVGTTGRLTEQFDDAERWTVLNPVIRDENFADKWKTDPQRRETFFRWHGRFQADVRKFIEAAKMSSISESLDALVGEPAKTRAFNAHGEMLNEMQRRGQLGVTTLSNTVGAIATTGSKVIRPHTNYGRI